jgi:hypothetical protein
MSMRHAKRQGSLGEASVNAGARGPLRLGADIAGGRGADALAIGGQQHLATAGKLLLAAQGLPLGKLGVA